MLTRTDCSCCLCALDTGQWTRCGATAAARPMSNCYLLLHSCLLHPYWSALSHVSRVTCHVSVTRTRVVMTSVSCGAGCHWQAGPRYLDIWISKYLHYLQLERRDARVGPRAVYILLTTGPGYWPRYLRSTPQLRRLQRALRTVRNSAHFFSDTGSQPSRTQTGVLQNLFRHPWSRDFSTDWTLQYFSCDPPHFNLLLSPFIHRKLTILIWGFVGKILSMIF